MSIEPDVVEDLKRFLCTQSLFGFLSDEDLERAVRSSSLRYYAKGFKIVDRGSPKGLYVVYRGAVRIEAEEGGIHDFLEEGDIFGIDLLLKGVPLTTVEAVEDTVCLIIEEKVFWDLYRKYPSFAKIMDLLLKGETLWAYEHSVPLPMMQYSPLLYERRVIEVIKKEPVTCYLGTTVKEAAKLMSENHVSSIIVVDEKGRPLGIVTDADLRRGLVSAEPIIDKPVDLFMSRPVFKVSGDALCWEALALMAEKGVKYLPVVVEEKVVGVVTLWDLTSAQLQTPVILVREVEDAQTLEELRGVMWRVVDAVKAMYREGINVVHVAKMLSSIYDRLVMKALHIAEDELSRELSMSPPVKYAWIALGSEGRREQLLKTDQDSALIFDDPPSGSEEEVSEYFKQLAVRAATKLAQLGFPKCPHGFTADNPLWNKSLRDWTSTFEDWVLKLNAKPENVMFTYMFSDARLVYGSHKLVEEFKKRLIALINKDKRRLAPLARNVLVESPPIDFLKRFVIERDGTKERRVDIKVRGLTIIMTAVKILAIDRGINVTNTIDRLRALANLGAISQDLEKEAAYAFNFLLGLRLREQLRGLEMDKKLSLEEIPSGRYVSLTELSKHERTFLKEAFKVVRKLQDLVAYRFLGSPFL